MRLIFLFILCFVSSVSFGQEEFKISGTLEGCTDGNVFLLKPKVNEWDTLAFSEMKNGIFELRGKQEGIGMVTLVIAGEGEKKFMLEKGQFIVRGEKGNIRVEGGDAQKLYKRFQEIPLPVMTQKEEALTKKYYQPKEDKN